MTESKASGGSVSRGCHHPLHRRPGRDSGAGSVLFVLIGRSRTACPRVVRKEPDAETLRRHALVEVRSIVTGGVLLSTGTSTASKGTGTQRPASAGTRFADAMRSIGGPYSVTWFAFWVTLAQNLIHHLSASPEINGHWGVRMLAVLASQLVMFGILLLARSTFLRHTATRPRPIATLVTFVLAGAARGLVLILIVSVVVPLSLAEILLRPVAGAYTYAVTLALCSYLASVFHENKKMLVEAERAQAVLVQAREAASRDLAHQRSEAVEQIRADLLVQFDALTASSPQLRPQQLDEFLDDALRPTSHRLASAIEKWQPRGALPVEAKLRFRRVVGSVGLVPPFAPVLQASFVCVFCLAIVAAVPMPRGPLALLVIFLSTWGFLTLGNSVLARACTGMPATRRLIAVVLMTLVSSLAVSVSWAAALVGTDYFHSGMFYGLFLTPLLAAMSIAAKAALTGQRELESELEQSREELRWDIVRVHQLQWQQQKKAARALHGPVQGVIIAEAMRMGVGPEELRSTTRLRRILELALDEAIGHDGVADLDTAVEVLVSSWSALCRVHAKVMPGARSIEGDRVALSCLVDLVGEATGNAVRHGGARNVRITIHQVSERVLRVDVTDDGQHREASQRRGLGSQILDDCCLEWWRTSESGGTRLLFLLPFVPDRDRSESQR